MVILILTYQHKQHKKGVPMDNLIDLTEEINEKGQKQLRVTLLPEGKEEIEQWIEEGKNLSYWLLFCDLLEEFTCNGWEYLDPNDYGWLTDDTRVFISDNLAWHDENDKELDIGLITDNTDVYTYNDYWIKAPVEELYKNGFIILNKVIWD